MSSAQHWEADGGGSLWSQHMESPGHSGLHSENMSQKTKHPHPLKMLFLTCARWKLSSGLSYLCSHLGHRFCPLHPFIMHICFQPFVSADPLPDNLPLLLKALDSGAILSVAFLPHSCPCGTPLPPTHTLSNCLLFSPF